MKWLCHSNGASAIQQGVRDRLLESWLLSLALGRGLTLRLSTLLSAARLLRTGVTSVVDVHSDRGTAEVYAANAREALAAYDASGIRVAFAAGLMTQCFLVSGAGEDEKFLAGLPDEALRGFAARRLPPPDNEAYYRRWDVPDLVSYTVYSARGQDPSRESLGVAGQSPASRRPVARDPASLSMVTKPATSATLIRWRPACVRILCEYSPVWASSQPASAPWRCTVSVSSALVRRRVDLDSARVKDFLPDSLLDRLEAPLGEATGLPNAAYVCGEFFGLEQRYLFRRSWVLAGRADEIRGHGDIKPVDAGGVPVILVRGEGGEIRAFQNVCRHRGTRLVDACQRARQSIVCPYHAWSYDLAGRLRRRPHFHGGGLHDVVASDDAGFALFEVPLAQWHHWLFVNVDGNMPPLDEHLRFLDEKLAGYRIGAMAHAGALEFEIAANWKFVHENFIEPYHVFAAHPRLHTFVPMEERTPSFVEGHVLWNRYRFRHAEEGRGLGLPHFPDLDEESAMQGIWFTVAPSFSIEVYPDHIAMFEVEPLAPDRSRERISIFLAPEAASGERYARNRQAVLDMWEDLNREDIALLEGLQRGRAAPAYDGGVLSPYWDEAPRALARNLARTMREEAGRC